MTIVQLKYIVAVDTYRHFATAADKCFVTQPTLSMQIHKLEKELEVLIFDRSKQPVQPTDIGKKILAQARLVIQEADRIEEIIKQNKGIVSGEFKLGVIPTVSPNLLPRFLSKFVKKYPLIKLKVEELQTEQIIEMLRADQLDAGILATPLEEKGIIEDPMYYEPFMAFIPSGHRFEKDEFVLVSELDLHEILLLKNGHCFRNNVINLCKHAFENDPNPGPALELESGNFETLIKLSRQGFGMTLIPYLAALDLKPADKKQVKPIENPAPTREISLVYSRAQLKMEIVKKLHEEIVAGLPPKLRNSKGDNIVSPLDQEEYA